MLSNQMFVSSRNVIDNTNPSLSAPARFLPFDSGANKADSGEATLVMRAAMAIPSAKPVHFESPRQIAFSAQKGDQWLTLFPGSAYQL